MSLDVDELLDLFVRLVEIPSPSGHERAVADFILAWLRQAGLEPTEDDTARATGAGSGNIVVRVPAAETPPGEPGPAAPIVVGAHIDTVAVDGPIAAVVEDGVVRSATDTILGGDNKVAVTALLAVLRDLAQSPPEVPVVAVLSASEEIGLKGAKALDVDGLGARAGFVFDASGPIGEVITRGPAQKTITAEFHGIAAHAGMTPESGRSAIAAASHAITSMRLGRIDELTTANIGLIEGGTANNIVPERCRIVGEARSHDPARLASQVTHMIDAVQLAAGVAGIDVETSVVDEYQAFALADDALPVRVAAQALRALGVDPRFGPSGGGSDANVFNVRGLPSVNLSVGMEKVHTPDEYLPVARLDEAYRLLHAIVRAAAAA
ncbi:MAG TPA: M20/M25/M40 family metallo-hydrolase [Thermoleophilia bacterium]|nr:M20/M25/M40 family metallo-hydrolase [Thermoleophilia bacterium]